MDDLRTRIWDYLFQHGNDQQVEIIAQNLEETTEAIRQAVNDPWFDEREGSVAIAQS